MTIQQDKVPQVIDVFKKGKKWYLKSFLVDDSIAQNGMGLVPSYISRNINKFLGKPVILTPNKYHPHEFDHFQVTGDANKDVPQLLELQKPYTIGQVVEVKSNIVQGSNRYDSLLEIWDEKVIEAFENGKIPKFVSPSIYKINQSEPDYGVTDFDALHVAIVDVPAYGFEKANIKDHVCQSDKNTCSMILQGGCNMKILENFKHIYQGSIVPIVSNSDNNSITLSQQEEVTQTKDNSAPTENVEQVNNKNINNSISAEITKQLNEINANKTPIGTPAKEEVKEAPVKEEAKVEEETPCAKRQAELENIIANYEAKFKAYDERFEAMSKKEAENIVSSKKAKLESLIPNDYANSVEERAKLINLGLTFEGEQFEDFINKLLIPVTSPIKQGGRKHTEFVKTNTNEEKKTVLQAGTLDLSELNDIIEFTSGNSS